MLKPRLAVRRAPLNESGQNLLQLNYLKNSSLKIIKPNWQGNPVDSEGRFINLESPFRPKFTDVLKWLMSRNPQRREKKEDKFQLPVTNDESFRDHQQDCIIWLGHATFFIRLNSVNILIDPVFYKVPLVKRYADHAYSPATFRDLDYLLISHDHQDHCQEKSIRAVVSQNPRLKILTGLNMEKLLRPWVNGATIEMAGWYQQYQTSSKVSISYLPSRHWSKRGLSDENKRLWGAFVFQTKNKVIYFSGDSGYGSHFKEAASLFPRFNVAIIGVGAYKPEWFMHPNHVSPADAVRGFNEMNAEVLIPMHYGTFDVSDEPVGEPLKVLKTLEQDAKINGRLMPLQLGENFTSF